MSEKTRHDTRGDVVVGFDGTLAGEVALDWAASLAGRRGVRLRIVTTNPYVRPPEEGPGGTGRTSLDPVVYAEQIATDGRRRAAKRMDEDLVEVVALQGSPAGTLVEASRRASLVVVGHPARGRARELVTGSVAFAVAAHAQCDVAVIPSGELILPGPDHHVIVGVDGAADGERAATRAAEIAALWHAPLEIVQAWSLSSSVGWSGSLAGTAVVPDDAEFFESEARQSVAHVATLVREAHPALAVSTIAIEEHPAHALTKLAGSAGLLVVGTRGLGGFERLILGSVSRAIVHHATCPALVVRT